MKNTSQKNHLWKICAVVAFILVLVTVTFKIHYTENDAWNELLALDSSVSMDDLKEKGFIDVSCTMDSSDRHIEEFLRDVKNRRGCVLRIANILDGKLCAKILFYNKSQDVIKMWTLYPKEQQGETPGKYFYTEPVIEKGDVTTVYLKNVPDASMPIPVEIQEASLEDEVLYSYKSAAD